MVYVGLLTPVVFLPSLQIKKSIVYRFLKSNPYCAFEERRWLKSKKVQVGNPKSIVEAAITVNRFGM